MAKRSNPGTPTVPEEILTQTIHSIRGERVMLDADLAGLYGVETKVLLQAVKRNLERFPADFMFQLTKQEFNDLRSQIVTSRWGGRRYPPYAFSEHGVAMLSSVLRSPKAIAVNIEIVRAFVRLRKLACSNHEIAQKLDELDRRVPNVMDLDPLAVSARLNDRPATIRGKWLHPDKAMLERVQEL